MKFENILNSFNPTVTVIDLTEKETAYIAMLISGADRYRITELLSIESADIDELYKKFGLMDDSFNLEEEMKAVVSFNDMLTEDILNEVYIKYNVPECREFAELKRKAPKAKFRTAFMPVSESHSEHKGKARVSGRLERKGISRRSKKQKLEEHEVLTSFMQAVKEKTGQ